MYKNLCFNHIISYLKCYSSRPILIQNAKMKIIHFNKKLEAVTKVKEHGETQANVSRDNSIPLFVIGLGMNTNV